MFLIIEIGYGGVSASNIPDIKSCECAPNSDL